MPPRRLLALPLVLALSAAGLFARKPPELDPNRVINESFNFRKNHEPEMTEAEYALYDKAVTMIKIQPEFALKLLEGMMASGENQSPAFEFALANLYYHNNRSDLAEQHYRNAIKRFPEFTRAWSNLGAILYSQARYAEAAECLVKTIEGGERTAQNLGLLAYCLEKTDHIIAAEMDYIQALGLEPANADYLEGLVYIYYNRHDYARAEGLLPQLIRAHPNNQNHWLLYASVLTSENRPLEALALLESARSLGVLDPDGLVVLGDLYAKQHFDREATDVFASLTARATDLGTDRLLVLAQSLIASGRLPAAESALAAIGSDLSPKNRITFLQTKADLFAAHGDTAHEREQLEALLALDPLDGRALLSLGRLEKADAHYARADLALESAAQQSTFAYQACLEIADIALKTRRYARGLDYLQRAAALDRSVPLQQYIAKVKLILADHENAPAPQ